MSDVFFNFFARHVQRRTLGLVAHQPTLRRLFAMTAAAMYRPVSGVKISRRTYAGVRGLDIRPTGDSSPISVLYFHGGGFTIGSAETHKWLAARIALGTGRALFVPDYRLAPEHPFPAAVEDAEAVFDALTEFAPLSVAGDSAGGNLALSLCATRRPSSAVLLSPLVDMSIPLDDPTMDFSNEMLIPPAWVRRCLPLYASHADRTDPRMSPILGDLKHAPPMLIQVAKGEALESHARRVAAAIPHATLEMVQNAPHVWQLHAGWNAKADRSIENICAFLKLQK